VVSSRRVTTVLLPDHALVGGELVAGAAVAIDAAGWITQVGPPAPGADLVRLPGKVLLPAFVNAHSHAFQRAIRGRTEWRSPGRAHDDFWTWREQMYAAALRMSPEDVESVSRLAYVEMALSGIAVVGEFHYLHHAAGGARYADPDELAHRVLQAAGFAGLDPVLLRVGYARAGAGRPAEPRQARFLDEGPEDVIAAAERLAAGGVRVGLAPHSVRAQPLPWIRALGAHARSRGWPLHMHVAEQPREVEECVAEHGVRPAALLEREGLLDARFTGVHGVHLDAEEIRGLGRAAATICACPTTERNLGDGIVPAGELLAAGVTLALGTDSQCQVAPLEDARQLEYHLRLQLRQRAILGDPGGDAAPVRIAGRVLEAATSGGARALGVPAGRIAPGQLAHLTAIDLADPSVCGATPDTLLAAIVFGAERTALSDLWVAGRRVVQDRRHAGQEEAVRGFEATMRRLWS
jgi:formimidoylglutamate deiminase